MSQIWNAIIISMYREHLLSIEHVQKLLYHQVDVGQDGRRSLRAPAFFISQSDKGFRGQFFTPGSEAERRISFFAQMYKPKVRRIAIYCAAWAPWTGSRVGSQMYIGSAWNIFRRPHSRGRLVASWPGVLVFGRRQTAAGGYQRSANEMHQMQALP